MKPKIIVNTNRIIAALIKDSVSRKLIYHANIEFLGVHFSRKEIEKYRKLIIKKANITETEFEQLLYQLNDKLIFIEEELLNLCMEEAKKIMFKIDPDDVPFIAAALATGADIWSDDLHFIKQKRIKVWRTEQLLKFL